MSISKLNKGSKFKFQYKSENVEYFKLADFVTRFGLGTQFTIRAAHINRDGKYGPSATLIVTDNNGNVYGVNCPKHMIESVEFILNTTEYIDDIDNQHAGMVTYEYTDNDGTNRYSIKFVDI